MTSAAALEQQSARIAELEAALQARDAQVEELREALRSAKYAIKGREHTGFIDDALANTAPDKETDNGL